MHWLEKKKKDGSVYLKLLMKFDGQNKNLLHFILDKNIMNDNAWDDCDTFFFICVYSHNGRFSYGYASSPGRRSSMEDFYETRIDGVDGEIVGLFGVFDGKPFSHLHLQYTQNGKYAKLDVT